MTAMNDDPRRHIAVGLVSTRRWHSHEFRRAQELIMDARQDHVSARSQVQTEPEVLDITVQKVKPKA